MQLSRYPNILFFGASKTIYIPGENKKSRVQHNGEIMSQFKVEKSKLQSSGGLLTCQTVVKECSVFLKMC